MYDPLSQISMTNLDIVEPSFPLETVPWSERLVEQYGEKIRCIPYSMSPFALPDIARTLSSRDAIITDGFRLDPTSIKFRFVWPLYHLTI